jgi:hypothetical protein
MLHLFLLIQAANVAEVPAVISTCPAPVAVVKGGPVSPIIDTPEAWAQANAASHILAKAQSEVSAQNAAKETPTNNANAKEQVVPAPEHYAVAECPSQNHIVRQTDVTQAN